jgi:drug/metabolite transporter (DMT)-like permease
MDNTNRPHTSSAASPKTHHRLGILLILVSTIAWSSAGLFVRLLPFDVWTIIVWRGVFGTLFIGSFVFWRFGWTTFSLIRKLGIAGVSVTLCSTAAITLFPAAFQNTSVANATTILAAIPFITAAIAWLWLRERPSMPTLIASAVALAGIIIMLGPSSGGPRLGDFLAFLATVAMALLTVTIRSSRQIEMLPVAMLSTLLSTLIALPLAQHLADLAPRDYIVAAGFGLFPMTLGLMLYVIGSALIPSTLSALIGTLEAPIAALLAWVGVGELPATETFIGGSIVLVGVIGRLLYDWNLERRQTQLV